MELICLECGECFEYEDWIDDDGNRHIPEFPVCGECGGLL